MDEYISKYEAYKMLKDKQASYMQVAVNEAFGTAARMIAQIKPAEVQPVRENYINVISERFRVSNYVQNDRKGYLLHDTVTGQRQFIYTLTDVEDEARIILEGERS